LDSGGTAYALINDWISTMSHAVCPSIPFPVTSILDTLGGGGFASKRSRHIAKVYHQNSRNEGAGTVKTSPMAEINAMSWGRQIAQRVFRTLERSTGPRSGASLTTSSLLIARALRTLEALPGPKPAAATTDAVLQTKHQQQHEPGGGTYAADDDVTPARSTDAASRTASEPSEQTTALYADCHRNALNLMKRHTTIDQ
jgi:hypothetical protein